MKWITVPAAIIPKTSDGKPFTVQDENGAKVELGEVTMHKYLMDYIVNETNIIKDPATDQLARELKIGNGYEGNKRTRKLDRAFESTRAGQPIGIEDQDWKVIKTIIEEKRWPSATFGSQFVDFEDAWMSAVDNKPAFAVNGTTKEAEIHA